jgi:hypothetical protein
MKTFKTFLEATIKHELPKNPNGVNPALLTFPEYNKIANEHDKWHSSDSYDWSLERMKQMGYLQDNYKEKYPKLVNTFSVKGINFELRANLIDRHSLKYVKYGDDDEIVRDEKGLATYQTPEELKAKGLPKHGYEFIIVDKDIDTVIGTSQDEWGAILIAIAREYRGYGLGKRISAITRKYYPTKASGGFTNAGFNTFFKVYKDLVKEYLVSGKYNQLLKRGELSMERLKKILKSAELPLYKDKHEDL